ncbi:tumor necrosis factor alpha-induced protein 2-like isoform X2 [Brienomyrus brachyistius]|uniref:tumor necrosis factor alpha-induced protein 2-like isoform X2 n=1 Tax=Brienomyrus brachyistius TaxID=42636 RepID=UPI0020B192A3|nr:tumor necrosis factor alpha-induced protein 2-like isoform X2 [Brienomyrus brachyistius]
MRFFKCFRLFSKQRRGHDNMTITTGSHPNTPVKTRGTFRINWMPRFLKKHRRSATSSKPPVISDPSITLEELEVLNFQECLNQKHFSKAAQTLIIQENSLFAQGANSTQKDRNNLESDYNTLLNQIWLAIRATFEPSTGPTEILKEAAKAIQLEEEQDRKWKDAGLSEEGDIPVWRPRGCRTTHDSLLQQLVTTRLEDAEDVSGAENLSSSLKKEICRKGKRLKDDLLQVVQKVKLCYPEEFDICNLYAKLYHDAFAKQLKSIAEFGLDTDDSVYLLNWVNDYYPRDVLKHNELELDINTEALGPLLPEEMINPLKDLYLTNKESTMQSWGHNVLEKEMTNPPNKIDGYYSTDMAIDYLQLFDSAVKDATIILEDPDKVKKIAAQLRPFLTSYKRFLQEMLREKQGQAAPKVKAHLASLIEFKQYIENNGNLFTTAVKDSSLSVVAELIDASSTYLTSIAHKALKPKYSKLGTEDWFSGKYIEVLDEIEKQIKNLKKNLRMECYEVLFGHMHRQVLVEYVRRLFKKKVKLSDRVQQESAAALVCADSSRLAELFTEAGSREDWLQNLLPKIADVLRTQDLPFIQLEVAVLARDYPDLSSRHIGALLNLKHNLSSEDISKIKQSVKQTKLCVTRSENCQPFFSMVVKWQRLALI